MAMVGKLKGHLLPPSRLGAARKILAATHLTDHITHHTNAQLSEKGHHLVFCHLGIGEKSVNAI